MPALETYDFKIGNKEYVANIGASSVIVYVIFKLFSFILND